MDGNDFPAFASLNERQRETERALILRGPRAVTEHYPHVAVDVRDKVVASERETAARSLRIRNDHLFSYLSRRSYAYEVLCEQTIERRAVLSSLSVDPFFCQFYEGFFDSGVTT